MQINRVIKLKLTNLIATWMLPFVEEVVKIDD